MKEVICLNGFIEGVLDVIVGFLVNLWGFGFEVCFDVVLIDEELNVCCVIIGIEYLMIEGNMLSKDIFELYVDLFMIVKGWGVDVVVDYF